MIKKDSKKLSVSLVGVTQTKFPLSLLIEYKLPVELLKYTFCSSKTIDNLDSIKIAFFYFRYGVFVIAIATLLEVDNKFIRYFFYCIFLCFVILTIDGYYQYFIGENILGWKNSGRVTSFFGEEKILGSYLARLWPIFFGLSLLFLNKKKKIFFLFILIFILTEALIFLSGDRTAFFYINLSAIFVILFSHKLLKLRLITLTLSLLLLVIIIRKLIKIYCLKFDDTQVNFGKLYCSHKTYLRKY